MEPKTSDKRPSSSEGRTSSRGRWVVVYSVVLLVVAAPLLIGGGPPWAQLICSALVFVAAILFAANRRLAARPVAFALPAAIAVTATLFQLLPLPAPLVRLLSPAAFELRTEVASQTPRLIPLTLDVPATVLEVAKGMACLTLLIVVGAVARRSGRTRPILLALTFIGGAVAATHLVQRALGATAILGLYTFHGPPGWAFVGTFVNGNQASSLLTLSALVAAGLAMESRGPLKIAAVASAVLSAGVVFTTLSKAGVLGLGAGAFVFGALALSRRFGGARGIALALTLVIGLGAAGVWASDGIRHRLAHLASTGWNDQKIRGWRDSMGVIGAYPWTGVGRGAFEAPATAHRSASEGVRLVFPETLPLQMASEWGLPLAIILAMLVIARGLRLARVVPRLDPATQGAACGVLAVVVHELGDFALELPGVAFPAVTALGIVVARIGERLDPHRQRTPRLARRWTVTGLGIFAGALVLGLWALPRSLRADGARLQQAVVKRSPSAATELATAIRRHPADYYLQLLAALHAIDKRDPAAGQYLNRAMRLHPADGHVHLIAARWLAKNQRASQAALEYRLAFERGAKPLYPEILSAVGPRYFATAVPQTADYLIDAAKFLARKGHVAEAREVSEQGVALEGGNESACLKRLEVALESRTPSFLREAARALAAVATLPSSHAAAADALVKAGDPATADGAIQRGLAFHPANGLLVLAGARLKLDRNDLTGATAILALAKSVSYTLSERIQMDELRASIAAKRGDAVTATLFRARAKALAKISTEGVSGP